MAQEKCPNCGNPVEEGSTECLKCGIIFERYEAKLKKEKQEQEDQAEKEIKEKAEQAEKERKEKAEQAERKRKEKAEQAERERKEKVEKTEREKKEKAARLKACKACDETISSKAFVCPHCGEPKEHPQKYDGIGEMPGVLGIFDFQFKNYITPLLVKFIYLLSVIFIIATSVLFIITGVFGFGFWLTIKYSFALLFGYVFFIVLIRIFCEGALILFKLEENTRR